MHEEMKQCFPFCSGWFNFLPNLEMATGQVLHPRILELLVVLAGSSSRLVLARERGDACACVSTSFCGAFQEPGLVWGLILASGLVVE